MAQTTFAKGSGCAMAIVRMVGVSMVIGGLANLFSGDFVSGIVITIIGFVLLFSNSGKQQRRKETQEALRQARQLYREPILQAKREVKEAVRMAENRTQQRAQQWQPQQQAAAPKKTDQPCPNPEPHRHYELPRQPLYNGARLIENRKTLYEAGLLTREEYDAEVRKLRGR